jgi:hypothetical protein
MHTIRRIELLALQITGVKYKFQLNISVYVVNYPQDNNYLLPIGTDYLMLPIGFVDNPSMRGSWLFAFIIKLDLFPYEISFSRQSQKALHPIVAVALFVNFGASPVVETIPDRTRSFNSLSVKLYSMDVIHS